MAKAFQCDRCGVFWKENVEDDDYYKEPREYFIVRNADRFFRDGVDLCPTCYVELVDWLNNKKEENINEQ